MIKWVITIVANQFLQNDPPGPAKTSCIFCMFGSDLNRSDMALPKMNILAETLGMMMFMKNWHQQVNYCKILQTLKKKRVPTGPRSQNKTSCKMILPTKQFCLRYWNMEISMEMCNKSVSHLPPGKAKQQWTKGYAPLREVGSKKPLKFDCWSVNCPRMGVSHGIPHRRNPPWSHKMPKPTAQRKMKMPWSSRFHRDAPWTIGALW